MKLLKYNICIKKDDFVKTGSVSAGIFAAIFKTFINLKKITV